MDKINSNIKRVWSVLHFATPTECRARPHSITSQQHTTTHKNNEAGKTTQHSYAYHHISFSRRLSFPLSRASLHQITHPPKTETPPSLSAKLNPTRQPHTRSLTLIRVKKRLSKDLTIEASTLALSWYPPLRRLDALRVDDDIERERPLVAVVGEYARTRIVLASFFFARAGACGTEAQDEGAELVFERAKCARTVALEALDGARGDVDVEDVAGEGRLGGGPAEGEDDACYRVLSER